MSFPKHEWLRAVARDKGLDDSYARVAMDLSTSASVDDGTFCVRQKTVAERMGRDVRSVKRAYAALKIAGYVEWVAAGKRGRGYLSGDTWRLRFPQVGSGDDRVTTYVSGDDSSPEVVTRGAISGDDSSPEVVTTQAADLPSASENGVPVVLNEGLYEGLEGGDARAATDEPLDAEVVPDDGDDPHPRQHSSEDKQQPSDVDTDEPAGRTPKTQRVEGIDDGTVLDGEIVEPISDPQPEPKCKRHPNGDIGEPCRACKRDNDEIGAWEQRQTSLALRQIFASAAEPARPMKRQPEPRPEPTAWIHGPHGPRCPRHGHLKVAPADCTRCQDAAVAAKESA